MHTSANHLCLPITIVHVRPQLECQVNADRGTVISNVIAQCVVQIVFHTEMIRCSETQTRTESNIIKHIHRTVRVETDMLQHILKQKFITRALYHSYVSECKGICLPVSYRTIYVYRVTMETIRSICWEEAIQD